MGGSWKTLKLTLTNLRYRINSLLTQKKKKITITQKIDSGAKRKGKET